MLVVSRKMENSFLFAFILFSLYQLGVANQTSAQSDLDSAMKEITQNQFVDDLGYVHVIGEIQNSLTSPIDFIKVSIAYYDSQNRIIGTDFVYSDPHTLLPGQSATYQALTGSNSLASSDVSSIKIHYEYEVNGVTHQTSGSQNRLITSNAGQSFGQQNDLTTRDTPMGASDEGCGEVIHGYFNLTKNLHCLGDGLIIGQDNTIVNLSGYSIYGPGDNSAKVGIAIPHSDNVVIQGNGSIHNFRQEF